MKSLRVAVLALFITIACNSRADIYRWDTGEVIPGTENITPRPSIDLSGWNTNSHNLRYADFSGRNLSHSNLSSSWLDNANLSDANLTGAYLPFSTLANANLTGANLAYASLSSSALINADLSGAVVTGASFSDTTSRGFTHAQLQSTASYQAKNLQGIGLEANDLTDWDFGGQNLTYARLSSSTLTNANLSDANLTDTYVQSSTLTNADLTSANLAGAHLDSSTLTNAKLSEANLSGAALRDSILTNGNLTGANLTGVDLSFATMTNADLTGAVVTRAWFWDITSRGFTRAQLESTASYQTKDLGGIWMPANDLTGWDFRGQNLSEAMLKSANLEGASLQGANLQGADLRFANLLVVSIDAVSFSAETIYNEQTLFPDGFDPVAAGLTLVEVVYDFNGDGALDALDLDEYQCDCNSPYLDVNGDFIVNHEDVWHLVKYELNTWIGDANLDGEFNSSDLVSVLASGTYETDVSSTWSTGDFNIDGRSNSGDLVAALVDGGYEQGPRTALSAVPEPATTSMLLIMLIGTAIASRSRRSRFDF